MKYRIVFDPAADADLAELYDYVAARAGRMGGRRYINLIIEHCAGFENFPQRGMRRDELGHGIRIVGFRHRASIVFRIDGNLVTIMRILHRGKSLGEHSSDDEDDL